MRKISILGSTGSIGTNTLKVIKANQNEFDVRYLTAGSNAEKLANQAKIYNPDALAIANSDKYLELKRRTKKLNLEIYQGREGILEIASRSNIDLACNSIVGAAGMEPTYQVLKAGNDLALSNKESLVMGGSVIMELAAENGLDIFPIDSEHNAIWQCLRGEQKQEISRLILTASGGPFRNTPMSELEKVGPREALNHPTWDMGKKITIDSATMMNKGFELIEASWLFDIEPENIDIIVHPQSVIHSMVEFQDGSIKAELGLPDMKLPIQYALFYPEHRPVKWEDTDLAQLSELTFEKPDTEKFRNLKLAQNALEQGGTAPTILNVANDIAVVSFLNKKIGFTEISDVIEKALKEIQVIQDPNIDDIIDCQANTGEYVKKIIKKEEV